MEYPNGFEVKPIPQTKKDRLVITPSLVGRLFERNQPTTVNGMTKDEFFKEFMDPEVT